MVNFPPGLASLSHAASFGAERRGWREGSGGVGWCRVRPSNSQFDGLELIWMFASAEMNFSCSESISQRKKPTKCCSADGSFGTFFQVFCLCVWWVGEGRGKGSHLSEHCQSPPLFFALFTVFSTCRYNNVLTYKATCFCIFLNYP